MKYIILIYSLLLSALTTHAQGNGQSRIVTDTIFSEVLGTRRAYTVVLPASFDQDKEKSYPILYLLHGMWGKNNDWTERGHVKDVMDRLVANGEACEMLIVSPDAGGGDPEVYQNGYFNITGWAYEDFFFTEFVPFIEKQYRAIGDKQHRAVAGFSMGGGGATSYGLRHPDLFCAVYAMSALMDIPDQGAARFDNPNGKLALLTRSVKEHSCVKYIKEANEDTCQTFRSISWFVDCGDDDFLLDRNIEFFRAMRNAGIPSQFRVRDGGHDWEYWHSALYTCLPFITRAFKD